MKAQYSFLILFSYLIFSCDSNPVGSFGGWSSGDWNWEIGFYTASVEVRDVNFRICHSAMLIFEGDTVQYYTDLRTGVIKLPIKSHYSENTPYTIYISSNVYMHRLDSTIFKHVDVTFKKGYEYPLTTVQFDIPR